MTFYIQSAKTGYVLDIASFDGDTGRVILWKPHGGTNQLWSRDDNNLIISQHREGFVLEVNESEQKVQVSFMTGLPNQQWHFDDDGFVRNDTGVVLDIVRDENVLGAEVIVHIEHGCKNQQFRQIYITPI